MQNLCTICTRIDKIKNYSNPFFVKELKSGYVVIGDHQFYKGYTLFLSKKHVSELHELDKEERNTFLSEMAMVAEAVFNAFKPDKLNYELLGNTDSHLHWHIFPRRSSDPLSKKAIWVIDKSLRTSDKTKPSAQDLEQLKSLLKKEALEILTSY